MTLAFLRQVIAGEEVVADGVPAPDPTTPEGEQLVHHDNTFGTPEEDAFRRDFTINALAYDISNFSVIDYVGGLEDLQASVVRSISDPSRRRRAVSSRWDTRITSCSMIGPASSSSVT